MSEAMMGLLVRGVWETLAMTFVSGFFGFDIGLPVGVLLYVTRPGQDMLLQGGRIDHLPQIVGMHPYGRNPTSC